MKKYLSIIPVLLLTLCECVFAQTDTTYNYLDKDWKSCDKQNAVYKVPVFEVEQLWHRQTIRIADEKLFMEQVYLDKALNIIDDTSKYYTREDTVYEQIFKEGKLIKEQAIDQEKRIIGYVTYGEKGKPTEQKGYDKNGNEIPNYIFKQKSTFPGGEKVYMQFLKSNLTPDVAFKNGAPIGKYKVDISFSINENGNITNVEVLNDPGYGMVQECLRVVAKLPKWEPALMFNKPVADQQRQMFFFTVFNR
jgi:hypothetical protein